jgi:hypothetical protein
LRRTRELMCFELWRERPLSLKLFVQDRLLAVGSSMGMVVALVTSTVVC